MPVREENRAATFKAGYEQQVALATFKSHKARDAASTSHASVLLNSAMAASGRPVAGAEVPREERDASAHLVEGLHERLVAAVAVSATLGGRLGALAASSRAAAEAAAKQREGGGQ